MGREVSGRTSVRSSRSGTYRLPAGRYASVPAEAAENAFQRIGREAGAVAFAAECVIHRSVLLQDGHCQSAQHGRGLRGLPLADPTGILCKCYIQHPVQAVLDGPVPANPTDGAVTTALGSVTIFRNEKSGPPLWPEIPTAKHGELLVTIEADTGIGPDGSRNLPQPEAEFRSADLGGGRWGTDQSLFGNRREPSMACSCSRGCRPAVCQFPQSEAHSTDRRRLRESQVRRSTILCGLSERVQRRAPPTELRSSHPPLELGRRDEPVISVTFASPGVRIRRTRWAQR